MIHKLFGRAESHTRQEVDVTSVVRERKAQRIQLIDVRERGEWQSGHIPGALHIPLGQLARRANELDPGQPIVTVCRSGRRSLDAVTLLERAGISGARSLAGGMLAWSAAGQPIER